MGLPARLCGRCQLLHPLPPPPSSPQAAPGMHPPFLCRHHLLLPPLSPSLPPPPHTLTAGGSTHPPAPSPYPPSHTHTLRRRLHASSWLSPGQPTAPSLAPSLPPGRSGNPPVLCGRSQLLAHPEGRRGASTHLQERGHVHVPAGQGRRAEEPSCRHGRKLPGRGGGARLGFGAIPHTFHPPDPTY